GQRAHGSGAQGQRARGQRAHGLRWSRAQFIPVSVVPRTRLSMPALPTHFYEADRRGRTSDFGLPADLLEKARGRIRIVALLVLFASGLDVLIWLAQRITIALGNASPLEATSRIPFAGSLTMFLV